MTNSNVVSFYQKPKDGHWTEDEKTHMLCVFSIIGDLFFMNASRRACKVLAAGFRDMTREHPEDARLLAAWADKIEMRAYDYGRVPYYPHERRYYGFGPASG